MASYSASEWHISRSFSNEVFSLHKISIPQVFHYGFLQQMWPNPQFPADLVTFTEEILHGTIIRAGITCKKILLSKSIEFGIPLK